jgi:hypothetical protein
MSHKSQGNTIYRMDDPVHLPEVEASKSDQRLLECLRGVPEQANDGRRAQLQESDWQGVAVSALKHGLRPFLYERLTADTAKLNVPDTVLKPLREAYLVNALRNELLYWDLGMVLWAFRQKGIGVIVLKGAHLAQVVYRTKSGRQMADIDLLVKPGNLTAAAVTLLEDGYSFQIEPADIEKWRKQHPGSHHLPSFAKASHPRLELHWGISAPPNPAEVPDVWEEACSARIAGVEARVLSPEDLLIHLCLHARLHRFGQGLRPVCDLSAAVRHYQVELDWNKVLCRAKAWRAERCVYLGLWLGKKLMEAPVPECVLTALLPNGLEARWAALAVEIVLSGAEVPSETEYALQLVDPHLRWGGAACRSGKAKFLLRKMFPPRDHMSRYMAEKHALPLSPLRNYTSYIIRALDLLGVGVRLARDQAARGASSDSARRLRWNGWLDEAAF